MLAVGSFRCCKRRVWSGNSLKGRLGKRTVLLTQSTRSLQQKHSGQARVKLYSLNVDRYRGIGLLLAHSREIKTAANAKATNKSIHNVNYLAGMRSFKNTSHGQPRSWQVHFTMARKTMPCNCLSYKFQVSKETVVLRRWENKT